VSSKQLKEIPAHPRQLNDCSLLTCLLRLAGRGANIAANPEQYRWKQTRQILKNFSGLTFSSRRESD
jgi:hypothetical protein